jgi:hypothetical protein
MSDLQDLRARLRDTRASPAVSREEGRSKLPFGIAAIAAIAAGFAIVTVTPKFYSVRRTATLPAFNEVKQRAEEPAAAPTPAPVATAPIKADYTGKSIDEVAGLADAVCAQRVAAAKATPRQASPVASDDGSGGIRIAAENERLHCFLSEGTARFCAPSQRRKATADVINYFKGIEYANASVGAMQKAIGRPMGPPSGDKAPGNVQLAPDPGVVEAIEGLLLAGYLSQGYRDDILSNVPHPYKDRFARVVGNRVPCPEKPWWQIWK